jgi:ribonuclease HI
MEYTIYTDGSYSNLHKEGAFAFIILQGDREVLRMAGKTIDPKDNSNRCELKAIIAAVHKAPHDATKIRIISDSMYALNTLNRRYKRRGNRDLFEIWDKRIMPFCTEIEFEWLFVKGHAGDEYNEICDSLCIEKLGYNPREEELETR